MYLCSNRIWHDGMCIYIFILISCISFIIPSSPRHWFPGLLRCEGFLREFVTPIVKVSKGTEVVSFFTLPVTCWNQNSWCSCVGWGAFVDMYLICIWIYIYMFIMYVYMCIFLVFFVSYIQFVLNVYIYIYLYIPRAHNCLLPTNIHCQVGCIVHFLPGNIMEHAAGIISPGKDRWRKTPMSWFVMVPY